MSVSVGIETPRGKRKSYRDRLWQQRQHHHGQLQHLHRCHSVHAILSKQFVPYGKDMSRASFNNAYSWLGFSAQEVTTLVEADSRQEQPQEAAVGRVQGHRGGHGQGREATASQVDVPTKSAAQYATAKAKAPSS